MTSTNEINIRIKDNIITNIEEIIKSISNLEYNKENLEYLSSLINRLNYANIANSSELIDTINKKLYEFNILTNEDNITNKEMMNIIKEYNEDLTKIRCIDSRQGTYLVLYENGVLSCIECGEYTVDNLRKVMKDALVNKSASEFMFTINNFGWSFIDFYPIKINAYSDEVKTRIISITNKIGWDINKIEVGLDLSGKELFRAGNYLFTLESKDNKINENFLVIPEDINKEDYHALKMRSDAIKGSVALIILIDIIFISIILFLAHIT